MKRLCILSEESVLSGRVRSGIGEVTDSIANAMTDRYAVSVVCPDREGIMVGLAANAKPYADGIRHARMFGADYYMIALHRWRELVPGMVDRLEPDILHSIAAPELIERLEKRPARCVYTIEGRGAVLEPEKLRLYDAVTTVSAAYAQELLDGGDDLAAVLREIDFRGITNGIMTAAFSPEKGLMLPAKYSVTDLNGKSICKNRVLRTYGISGDPILFLMACRLIPEKGIDEAVSAVDAARAAGGFVLFAGKGDAEYESLLAGLAREDGALWVRNFPHPAQAIPLLAGADFLLSPSHHETCGLMPMTACRFGCIPITTLAGGLRDNMDDDVAIVIDRPDALGDGITRAAALYADKAALAEKRRTCMERDYGWATRKAGYVEVYEGC